MLVRQPAGHALSQTAALADGATDAFSAVAHWLRLRPGVEVFVIGAFAPPVGTVSFDAPARFRAGPAAPSGSVGARFGSANPPRAGVPRNHHFPMPRPSAFF